MRQHQKLLDHALQAQYALLCTAEREAGVRTGSAQARNLTMGFDCGQTSAQFVGRIARAAPLALDGALSLGEQRINGRDQRGPLAWLVFDGQ